MRKIRESARGQQCQVRLPGICNHNPETVVLAHYRLAGYCGTGGKPPDYMAAYCCSACHDVCDGRVDVGLSQEERDLALAEGVMRTMALLVGNGLIVVR